MKVYVSSQSDVTLVQYHIIYDIIVCTCSCVLEKLLPQLHMEASHVHQLTHILDILSHHTHLMLIMEASCLATLIEALGYMPDIQLSHIHSRISNMSTHKDCSGLDEPLKPELWGIADAVLMWWQTFLTCEAYRPVAVITFHISQMYTLNSRPHTLMQHHIFPSSSPLTFPTLTRNLSFSSVQFLLQGGGSTLALVRQNIVEVLYLCARLENGLEWTMEFTFFIAIPNSTV